MDPQGLKWPGGNSHKASASRTKKIRQKFRCLIKNHIFAFLPFFLWNKTLLLNEKAFYNIPFFTASCICIHASKRKLFAATTTCIKPRFSWQCTSGGRWRRSAGRRRLVFSGSHGRLIRRQKNIWCPQTRWGNRGISKLFLQTTTRLGQQKMLPFNFLNFYKSPRVCRAPIPTSNTSPLIKYALYAVATLICHC